MKTPTEILYPRYEATIRVTPSKREPTIVKRLAKIEASAVFREHVRLTEELAKVQRAKPQFVCWHCPTTLPLKDLVLYDFVSYSNTMDNDRYDDYNIVCPKCGAFSSLKQVTYADRAQFKTLEEIT